MFQRRSRGEVSCARSHVLMLSQFIETFRMDDDIGIIAKEPKARPVTRAIDAYFSIAGPPRYSIP